MKDSPHLFDLVKSLSPAEKRNISLSILNAPGSKNHNPAHLKLFRALDKLKYYDPVKLSRMLNGEVKNLPFLKNYLMQILLKELITFHSGSSVDMGFHESLMEIEMLYKKGLFMQANKKLLRLEKEAEQKEKFEILLLCYQWERKLSIYTGNASDIFKKYAITCNKINDLEKYNKLSAQLIKFVREKGEARSKSEILWLKQFLKTLNLTAKNGISSFLAKLIYYRLNTICHFKMHDYPGTLLSVEQVLPIYEKIVPYDSSLFTMYSNTYCNKVLHLARNNRYTDSLAAIKEIRDLPQKAKKEKWKYKIEGQMLFELEFKCLERELSVYSMFAKYEKCLVLAPAMEKLLNNKEVNVSELNYLIFHFNIAYTYFIVGRYKQTLYHLQKIFDHKTIHSLVREDVYCFARLLLLITHYEMKTTDLPGYLLRSTYRFLKQRNRIYGVEEAILLFIRNKLLKYPQPQLLTKNFIELKIKIEKITEKPYERTSLLYFDFIAWLESKINRQDFSEIMKKKYSPNPNS